MNHDFTGKIPAKVRQALRRRGRKDWHYNEQTGHYMARYDAYKSAKAAAMAAIENGYRPDIERLEDIRMGWAAFRFNGNAPARYCEVEELARGAFRVWIFPAIALEEQR